jgi:hypothetical protein
LLKTHTTTWTECFTFTSANKILYLESRQEGMTNEQLRKPCQLVSDLDVVGGLYTNKRPSPPSFTNQIYHS